MRVMIHAHKILNVSVIMRIFTKTMQCTFELYFGHIYYNNIQGNNSNKTQCRALVCRYFTALQGPNSLYGTLLNSICKFQNYAPDKVNKMGNNLRIDKSRVKAPVHHATSHCLVSLSKFSISVKLLWTKALWMDQDHHHIHPAFYQGVIHTTVYCQKQKKWTVFCVCCTPPA